MSFFARLMPIAVALLLSSCATGGSRWMTDLEAVYPEARFIAATGSGDTRQDAEASAAASLARRFEVKVEASTVSRLNSSSTTADGKVATVSTSVFDQSVGLTGTQDFLNLRFSDPVTDKQGVVHVAAFLEKAPTAKLYRTRIENDLERIGTLVKRSQTAPGALTAFALADAAVKTGGETSGRIAQLGLLQPSATPELEKALNAPALLGLREAAAAKVGYRLQLEGDPDARLAGIVKAALAEHGIPYQATGALLVNGSLQIEPVKVSTTYQSVEWTLNLTLLDERGATVAAVTKLARENGLSDAEARTIAWREVEKRLTKDLSAALKIYWDGLIRP